MSNFSRPPSPSGDTPLRRRNRQSNTNLDSEASYHPTSDGTLSAATAQLSLDDIQQPDAALKCSVSLPMTPERRQAAVSSVLRSPHNYTELLQEFGYIAIIDAAFTESNRSGHMFFNHPDTTLARLDQWKLLGIQILADTPLTVLQALLDDTLCYKVAASRPEDRQLTIHFDEERLSRSLQRQAVNPSHWLGRQSGEFAPAIYVIILADDNGKSLTPRQLRRAVRWLQRYASGEERYVNACVRIDNMSRRNRSDASDIQGGSHHHFEGRMKRVQQLVAFTTALTAILDEEAPEDDDVASSQPFKHHLKYFGYTKNSAQRAAGHASGSTNWLKALFGDVCRLLFNKKDQNETPLFTFHTFTVGYPVSRDECRLAEELFCRLGNGYHYTGLGFNMADAGANASVSHTTDAIQLWEEREELRNKNPLFEPQLVDDLNVKHEAYLRDLDANDPLAEALAQEADVEAQLQAARDNRVPLSELDADLNEFRDTMESLWLLTGEGGATRLALSQEYDDVVQIVHTAKEQRVQEDATTL